LGPSQETAERLRKPESGTEVGTDNLLHTGRARENVVEGTRNLGESKANRQEGRPKGSEVSKRAELQGRMNLHLLVEGDR
jgi:hypothetical protein